MVWRQSAFMLAPRPRGFHVITAEVVGEMPDIRDLRVGLMHLFIQHTSASLAVNERVEPEVRQDMEAHFNRLAPEGVAYAHHYEGPDDMPAHLKAVMLGSSVTVPIRDGRLALGAWQGIYLCEHRDRGGARRLVVTVSGERAD